MSKNVWRWGGAIRHEKVPHIKINSFLFQQFQNYSFSFEMQIICSNSKNQIFNIIDSLLLREINVVEVFKIQKIFSILKLHTPVDMSHVTYTFFYYYYKIRCAKK